MSCGPGLSACQGALAKPHVQCLLGPQCSACFSEHPYFTQPLGGGFSDLEGPDPLGAGALVFSASLFALSPAQLGQAPSVETGPDGAVPMRTLQRGAAGRWAE